MYRYFPNNIPRLATILFIPILFSFSITFSQTKSNLQVLYSLNDSLTSRIINSLPPNENSIRLKLNLGNSYSIFSNQIRSGFIKNGIEIINSEANDTAITEINIVMENAGVKYGDLDRSGWFGGYYAPRTIFISGNYFSTASAKSLSEYYIAVTDTVSIDSLSTLENESFAFTKGKIPTEPLFSSIWEPVIAIGIAAAAVILFFSIRSK